jgi:hypothetical protein
MHDILTQINRLIKSIDSAKPEKARMEGEKKILMEALKAEFGLTSLKGVTTHLSELNKELAERKEKVRVKFETLQKRYQW